MDAATGNCPKCHTPDCLSMVIAGEHIASATCIRRQLTVAQANLVEIREETQKWINGYFSAGGLSSQDFASRILAISSRDRKESNA